MMNPSLPNPVMQISGPTLVREDEDVDFRNYLDTILDNRKLIVLVALAVSLIGIGYAFLAKPVYESNLLIHVEEDSPKEAKNILGEMGSLFEYKTAASAEMELLRSRLVVSRAIDNLRLYINVQPKYFPVIGAWLAHRSKQLSTPGLFGWGGYVWGTEKMNVSVFNVPDVLQNQEFVLTVENGGQYRLHQEEKGVDLKGKTGLPLVADTEYGKLELQVNRIDAKPGAQFNLTRLSRLATIEEVQKSLNIFEEGKQSGIINATLQGSKPKEVSGVLAEIGREYMRQNAARKTEEADRSLAILDKQLPDLKRQLEHSEAELNQFRNTHGTIDLGEEAKLSLQQSAAAKLKRIELEQKKTELLSRFTENHPTVIGVQQQIREINREIRQIAEHIKTLPLLEQDILRLNRDVKVNTDLYTALLNTAQQLRLISVAKGSNVRLVD
ncbi:MAG TPA: Wzz/FepE/Etk N-terminal domain-containing protein, partial [Burkholderiaceae bacterium]|nr:Wzz/FepE/Etk N-terminal domain-containing protein [Burkholderiaceae bacterium]